MTQNKEQSHTPTPWKKSGPAVIDDINVIAECLVTMKSKREISKEEALANAEFIVKAFNAHEELLATLKLVEKSGPLNNGLRDENTMARVSEAIAKAEKP